MKHCKKICAAILTLILVFTLFGLTAFAEEPESTVVPETVIEVKYSPDSVRYSGILYEMYIEPGTLNVGFEIVKDLPIGYTVYDVADTPYIDGIRVNGETVNSLKIPLTEGVYTYTIDVKIVYVEGLLGDIASMSDGTYDWAKLLSNPIILLQGIYFVLAIVSVLAGILAAFFGRNKKVKTADEIASKVSDASETAIANVEKRVTERVISEVLPIVQKIFDDIQNVVKAVTLSTSKSKEAPIALLETLKDSASVSTSELIDKVQAAVKEHLDKENADHTEKAAFLHSITTSEKPNSGESASTVPAEPPQPATKSIF